MNEFLYLYKNYRADRSRELNLIGNKLVSARKKLGLSQEDMAEKLRPYGVDVTSKQISKWENGNCSFNVYQFFAICCVLEVDPSFFTDAAPVQEKHNSPRLTAEGRRMVTEFTEYLLSTGRYTIRDTIKRCEMLVSNYRASAGVGFSLENGDDFEKIMVPVDEVPDGADFGVRIDGDSMEPVYHDGQLIWIQQTQTLTPGEVGLFVLDGNGYVKRFEVRTPKGEEAEEYMDSTGFVHPQYVLVSYNERYDPIPITPDRELRICGRVLG